MKKTTVCAIPPTNKAGRYGPLQTLALNCLLTRASVAPQRQRSCTLQRRLVGVVVFSKQLHTTEEHGRCTL